MHRTPVSVACLGLISVASLVVGGEPTSLPQPQGLGEPPALVALEIDTAVTTGGYLVLAGRDATGQLVVSGKYASGPPRDLTSTVAYTSVPEGVVGVSESGFVTPLSEGRATIRVRTETVAATVDVEVSHLLHDLPVNFPNQIVPIFTKYGCNGGGCHGKSGGQNGFRLSLLGFEPTEDYEHLVQEARGRRLFPASPDQSLLLQKAAGIVPHGGGARLETDSLAYQLLHRWVEQGMPYGHADDPRVVRIQVYPRERLLPRQGQQQLLVMAHYSDGSVRDVTRMSQFESNDKELAEVSETGFIKTGTATGSVAVMTRYQSLVDVFQATVPLGIEIESLPAEKNFIDELVFAKLKELGLPPSGVCDDSTFIRRVTIDVAGRLPTREEALEFLARSDPGKRDQLVDRLLESPEYADYFASKWSAILRNRRTDREQRYTSYAFHDWIRENLLANVPYDEFARGILAAAGQVGQSPAVAWYHEVRDQSAQVEDTAQLFLGLRIQCARCHHHPFERWSQQDYYGLAAFFSRVARKPSTIGRDKEHIFHQAGTAVARNPKTGQDVRPTPLGADTLQIDPETDPRGLLVDWMTDPQNPFFAKALVNRYWKHFFGRGLVDPEDDMRLTNPATNPQLLDRLAGNFAESGFDLKGLVRLICTSQAYALSATPNDYNQADRQNFSRFYPRRLNAEVLLDAIDALTASQSRFGGVPVGTRAVQLPDNAFDSYFLTVFGRPNSASACECERSSDVNLAQCLHLLNSEEMQTKIAGARADTLARDTRPYQQRIRDTYLVAFSREPTVEETSTAIAYLDQKKDNVKQAFEDILWALMNTKEFVFNH